MTATESQRTNQGLVLRSPWTLLLGAGETAQQFRMPATMAEDPHSVPSTRLVAHTYPQRQCQGGHMLSSGLCGHDMHTQIQWVKAPIYIHINKSFLKMRSVLSYAAGFHCLSLTYILTPFQITSFRGIYFLSLAVAICHHNFCHHIFYAACLWIWWVLVSDSRGPHEVGS